MKKKIITTMMATLMAATMIVPSALAATPEVDVVLNSNAGWVTQADGTAFTWGYNVNGRLGIGTRRSANQPQPVLLDTIGKWKTIAADAKSTIGIKRDGTLWSAGNNLSGTLGDGGLSHLTAMTQVGTDTNWASIQVMEGAAYALKKDGSLYTWGNNSYGKLGQGSSEAIVSTPVRVGTSTWEEIKPGTNSVLGIQTDGTLWSWGQNASGQLGINNITDQNAPQKVNSSTDWKNIIVVGNTMFVQKINGVVFAWGNNSSGMLGTNRDPATVPYNSAPESVGGGMAFSQFSVYGSTVVALGADGRVYNWGDNTNNKLGTGDTANRNFPYAVLPNQNWKKILATQSMSFALSVDGSLYGWGSSQSGVGGMGKSVTIATPKKINGTWRDFVVQKNSTLAIATDGTLWAWGSNPDGELGIGMTEVVRSPTQVSTDTDWNNMYADETGVGLRFFASKTSGELYGAGDNTYYGVGVGTSAGVLVMTKLDMPVDTTSPPTNVVGIAGDTKVTLTWDKSSTAKGYNIYVNNSSTPHNSTLVTGTTYEVTALANGTPYTFQIAAVNNSTGMETAKSTATNAITPVASAAPNPLGKYQLLPGVNKIEGNMVIATKRATDAELYVNGYEKAVTAW